MAGAIPALIRKSCAKAKLMKKMFPVLFYTGHGFPTMMGIFHDFPINIFY